MGTPRCGSCFQVYVYFLLWIVRPDEARFRAAIPPGRVFGSIGCDPTLQMPSVCVQVIKPYPHFARRFKRLPLPKLCPMGFVFVWAHKQQIHPITKQLYAWGCQ